MKTIIVLIFLSIVCYSQEVMALKPGPDEGKDAWIWSFPKAQNYNWGVPREGNHGLDNVFRAESWIWFESERTDTIRGLIQFDLSTLPENAVIDSAKLNLFFFSNPGFTKQEGENFCYVERIVEKWNEAKVSWVNQPATTTEARLLLPKSHSDTSDYSIDITDFVRFFYKNPDANNGLMFKMKEESEYRGLTFASSDHENESLRPELIIYYRKQN